MAKAPAYQWYPKDADTDEVFMRMTYEQEGVYRRLLDHQWLEGSIPMEPSDIARLVPKMVRSRFLRVWPGIEPKFPASDDGRRRNPRMHRDREGVIARRDERAKSGQIGAASRWHGSAMKQPLANDGSASASASASASPKHSLERDAQFETFKASYPKSRRTDDAETRQAWVEAILDMDFTGLMAALANHNESAQWRERQVIPSMKKWLREKRWQQELPKTDGEDPALSKLPAWARAHIGGAK